MSDKRKRTYKLKDKSISVVDTMADNTVYNKSEFVNRAILYYYRELMKGELDDPAVVDQISPDDFDMSGGKSDDSSRGILDKIRGGD